MNKFFKNKKKLFEKKIILRIIITENINLN
jgi:hypothetical protein